MRFTQLMLCMLARGTRPCCTCQRALRAPQTIGECIRTVTYSARSLSSTRSRHVRSPQRISKGLPPTSSSLAPHLHPTATSTRSCVRRACVRARAHTHTHTHTHTRAHSLTFTITNGTCARAFARTPAISSDSGAIFSLDALRLTSLETTARCPSAVAQPRLTSRHSAVASWGRPPCSKGDSSHVSALATVHTASVSS